MLYNRVKPEDGAGVQYVGVYVLRWRPEWSSPTAGFAEYDTEQMLDRLMVVIEGLTSATVGIENECRTMLRNCIEPGDEASS